MAGAHGDEADDGRGDHGDALGEAVEVLRRWADTLPESPVNGHAVGPTRQVASAVVDGFEHWLLAGPEGSPDALAASLVATEPGSLRSVQQVGVLREACQRVLVAELEPGLAIQALQKLNQLVDAVLRETTERAMQRLQTDAFSDPLTGAGNRRAFERDFQRVFETSKRHERELAIVVLDLDGLKRLNDSKGHAAGDQALRALADSFARERRGSDGFYRIGGDEFALLLPESGPEAVQALLDRASRSAPSFSHGWASYPNDGKQFESLVALADQRLLEGRKATRLGVRAEVVHRPASQHRVAVAAPVLAAVVLAELVRQVAHVRLTAALGPSWVAMLVLAGVLGTPVARRSCSGHVGAAATALCSSRVAIVVLVVLVASLVPMSRISTHLGEAAGHPDDPAAAAAGQLWRSHHAERAGTSPFI